MFEGHSLYELQNVADMNAGPPEELLAELVQIGSSEKRSGETTTGMREYYPIPIGIPGMTRFSSWETERTISIGEELLRQGGPAFLEKAQERVLDRLGYGALYQLQRLWRLAKLRGS